MFSSKHKFSFQTISNVNTFYNSIRNVQNEMECLIQMEHLFLYAVAYFNCKSKSLVKEYNKNLVCQIQMKTWLYKIAIKYTFYCFAFGFSLY